MRILIVSQYFPPEIGAPQARLSEFARYWASSGATVTVLTGMPNHPTGVVPPFYRRKIRLRESVDGYDVIRTWLYTTANEGVAKKTLSHLSFMVSSLLVGLRPTGAADVVVVSSPTFFSILSAWGLSRLKRARFVVEIRDLWPAIFVQLGILKSRPVIQLLERIELAAYHAADAVVTVTEGFRDNIIARGVPAEKVHIVYNGVDLERFKRLPPDSSWRRRLGAGNGACVVLYAGAHGISHALSSVIEAACALRSEAVHFAFVGEGAEKRRLAEYVADRGLNNVSMLSAVPHDVMPDLLAGADVCLVPLRDVPLFDCFVPSKLFEYLAAEKAVVGAVRGESAQILRSAGAVVVPPGDVEQLASAIAQLASDPEQRVAMGQRGRRYVTEMFDRRALGQHYLALLRNLAAE